MATIWLTYAWADNKDQDVDFIAQELTAAGLSVKLDRWVIEAGKRLWDQIAEHITNPAECDAWVMIASQHSLGSEACKEEFAFALDRALSKRGGTFPIMGLFLSTVDRTLLPPSLAVRLAVSARDPDWKERIVSAAEGRAPDIARQNIEPFTAQVVPTRNALVAFEVRPRAGVWSPFFVAVPIAEKDNLDHVEIGPRGGVPAASMLSSSSHEEQGLYVILTAQEVTPSQSGYIFFKTRPSIVRFGQFAPNAPQYAIKPQ